MSYALYRHFDKDGQLLYVGISNNPGARTDTHSASARWFDLVVRIEIERFPSRIDAIEAEERAIQSERPLHNLQSKKRRGVLSRRPEAQLDWESAIAEAVAKGIKVNRSYAAVGIRQQIANAEKGVPYPYGALEELGWRLDRQKLHLQ